MEYVVINIDETVFRIPIQDKRITSSINLHVTLSNCIVMNIDDPTMLLQGDIYALNSIQDQEIPRQI